MASGGPDLNLSAAHLASKDKKEYILSINLYFLRLRYRTDTFFTTATMKMSKENWVRLASLACIESEYTADKNISTKEFFQ